ncbi:hypothetical protein RHSIM_Rhsim07G0012900 [Rhododendron simsii]|uniref:PLAC8 family protein n=1 Tax=Rhododendron simsii TaxID=118357 RepID=A0A834LK31_RHOSS|nr:hypothetical protein RHSIM_Rhsim07G0012900 [Rhododendron simsii]
MVSQAHLDKMAGRQNYRNLWHTDLMGTMRADPGCTRAAVAICLAVADVEKVTAQNFVFAPRSQCLLKSVNASPYLQGFMFCLQQLACIFSIVACITGMEELQEASQILSCFADLVYCTVCACMQTQHKVEMDKRDGKFGPQPAMAVPPPQQMSRMDQSVPPSVGYPPPPAYGQPYGYPPPQNQGYPPAAYPPPAGAYPPQGYPPAGYPR